MRFGLLTIALGSILSAQAPVATVASRAPITIQGASAPVIGSTAWPVAMGDVIQTSTAPAEVRLTDGTRVFVPPASRFVIGGAASPAAQAGGRADLGVRAAVAAPRVSIPAQRKTVAGSVATMIGGGALIVSESPALKQYMVVPQATTIAGTTPVTLSLTALVAAYGPNAPIAAVVAQAMTVPTAMIQQGANGSYYITGINISNAGVITNGTIVVNPASTSNPTGSIVIYVGTVTPTSGTPPIPLITVVPAPAASGSPVGCKGLSLSPADVSNGLINTGFLTGTC